MVVGVVISIAAILTIIDSLSDESEDTMTLNDCGDMVLTFELNDKLQIKNISIADSSFYTFKVYDVLYQVVLVDPKTNDD